MAIEALGDVGTVNVHDAKSNLSKLLVRVEDGETIVIARAGKPVARLVPFVEEPPRKPQRIGAMKGRFTVPDDFDTMMQDEIIAMFEGTE